MKINTPNELPRVDIIDRSKNRLYTRHEYSNGLILVSEMTAGNLKVSANYKLIRESDGTYSPDFDSPNSDFYECPRVI
ncbi:hypothetical protein [Pediococcus pentosaceus]|uniref:hypothetical protein n=1 Tax=Pediococcus pentosaceus TaxID=1255 RepID=UPI001F5AA1B2|nr:hypothetical protein [Pediococcus pentosaceus]